MASAVQKSRFEPRLRRAMPWLVLLVAVGIGASLYAGYVQDSRHIWYGVDHDRSAHYEFALNLALAVRHGDLLGVLHHLDGARVWGPLHGIVLAVVELCAGPDRRLAVLPSWCAWVASVVLAFLLARRMLPACGTAAGILAALCVLQSPAHRAFAVDVMLESLGAALTLLCLLRYLIAVQEEDLASFRWLGLSLSLLFFTKSNYWLLVVLGLLAGECVRCPAFAWSCLQSARRFVGRDWVLGQLRSPWTWMTFAAIGVSIATTVSGGTVVTLGSVRINATSGANAIHLAYAIVFVRVALWWRRNGIGAALAARHPAWRAVADWHALPVVVYFLLPKRFGYFLWFVSPANTQQVRTGGLAQGVRFYLEGLAGDYSAVAWLTPVALVGVLLAAAFARRWRTGAPAVLLFLFLIALATCRHPMLKYRFAFSWVAVLWVVAAAGFVHLLCASFRGERQRALLATALCAGFAVAVGPCLLAPGHAQEGGLRPDLPCVLDIADAYLPALGDARRPTILSSVYAPFFLSWTYQEEHRKQGAAFEIKNLDPASPDPQLLTRWADTTKSSALVLIDIQRDSPFWLEFPGNLDVAACRRTFEGYPDRFALTREWTLPQKVRISMWTITPHGR